MESLHYFFNILIHLDHYLVAFVANYGVWTYGVVAAIIFCETGLVIAPFFPGDSLLFAVGTLAAQASESLNGMILLILLSCAAFLGNQVNYSIGRWVGPRVFTRDTGWLINKKNLLKAHAFYEKHGGITLFAARFMPIIRTYVPFVAGVSQMNWKRFTLFNGVSALVWIGSLLSLGYFFGSIPVIKNNFSLVIYGIIGVSFLPVLWTAIVSSQRTESPDEGV